MENKDSNKELLNSILEQYGKKMQSYKEMTTGVGGDTFEVKCGTENLILKISDQNSMNRPEAEPAICEFLR